MVITGAVLMLLGVAVIVMSPFAGATEWDTFWTFITMWGVGALLLVAGYYVLLAAGVFAPVFLGGG